MYIDIFIYIKTFANVENPPAFQLINSFGFTTLCFSNATLTKKIPKKKTEKGGKVIQAKKFVWVKDIAKKGKRHTNVMSALWKFFVI